MQRHARRTMMIAEARTFTEQRTLSQADLDRFAALSGDCNPIHVDPEFAAHTRFGRTIAHGALLVCLLAGMIRRVEKRERIVSQAIRFPTPAHPGQELELEVRDAG